MSNLLKMHLATQNRTLKQRVQAALVKLSQQQKDANGSNGAYANIVLSDITREWPDFILHIAANPSIQESLVLADDHSFIVTTLVTDSDIEFLVTEAFWEAAKKYAPQPDNEGEEEDEGDQ